jgi:hypothetical protein
VIIESSALNPLVIPSESERLDQMEPIAGIGTKTNDVTGVGRDFRLIKHNIEHGVILNGP